MKKKISVQEVSGKTIEEIVFSFSSESFLIAFNDSTFVALGYVRGFHRGEDGIADIELDISDFYEEDLIRTLVDSPEELVSIRKGIHDRLTALTEAAEHKTYQRLKAKYENSPGI